MHLWGFVDRLRILLTSFTQTCYPNQVFRAMHKIYSSAGKMSIYPLVFNLEWVLDMDERGSQSSERERGQEKTLTTIDFWINSVARYSGGAPLLLIGTHKDLVVGGADLVKSNTDLATSNSDIKRANKIIGNYIKEMKVYKSKVLNLHLPKQPSLLRKL